MKALTLEWLERALDDLQAADVLLGRPTLTHLAIFHAQQAVEKSLKAAIEEYELGLVRVHSLTRLVEVVRPYIAVRADQVTLDRLEAAYIEARYPSDLGLLPYKPSPEDAAALCAFAQMIYEQIRAELESRGGET